MLSTIIDILQLPTRCLLNKKITKAFFKRNFDLTIVERSLLDKQIVGIDWLASLSAENINVPSYLNEDISYEEIQIITADISCGNFEAEYLKIAELIHKYIPYAILLCIYDLEQMVWSTFDKRVNQKDANKRIIDKRYFTEIIPLKEKTESQNEFLNSLVFSKLSKANLYELYNNYVERIFALQASTLNGTFTVRTQSRTQSDRLLLKNIEKLQQEVEKLSKLVRKETQLNKQVNLNLLIQDKRREITQLKLQIVSE